MSWLQDAFNRWKTEFDVQQKEKRFVQALHHVPDVFRNEPPADSEEVNFRHSGHAGDMLHAIPAMYALAKGKKINLYLYLNQPARNFTRQMKHPNGNVMFTQKSVELFAPLLLSQPQFNRCEAYTDQNIHYDLSEFREFPFDYRMGSITRWYFLAFAVNWDLGQPWIRTNPDTSFNNAVIVARTSRYRTPGIDYRFLQKYPRVVFVGLPEEFENMREQIPHMEYKPVKDFLELAQVIAGGKLFIGNQSLPSGLAEAMKVKRVVELSYLTPTTVVEGPDGYDACFQPQFERIVTGLLQNT
ncbi:MAG: hypothetical protein JWQ78_1288 [Sediminibacterium sp.]|nr:hypothetical protein [Sediminibacterium sp.]